MTHLCIMESVVPTIFWVILIFISSLLLIVLPIITLCFYILFRVEVSYRALKYQETSTTGLISQTSSFPEANAPPQSAVKNRRESGDLIGPFLPNYVMLETVVNTQATVLARIPTPALPPVSFSQTPPPSYETQ